MDIKRKLGEAGYSLVYRQVVAKLVSGTVYKGVGWRALGSVGGRPYEDVHGAVRAPVYLSVDWAIRDRIEAS